MAQWVEYFTHKPEEPSSIPGTHVKKPMPSGCTPVIPRLERQKKKDTQKLQDFT